MSTATLTEQTTASPAPRSFSTVKITDLKLGSTLRCPIYDARSDRNVLLVGSGAKLNRALLTRLSQRGISDVRIETSELEHVAPKAAAAARSGGTARKANGFASRSADALVWRPNSFINQVRALSDQTYDAERSKQFSEEIQHSVAQVDGLFGAISEHKVGSASTLSAVSAESLRRISEDLDLFVSLGLQNTFENYPSQHSFRMAMTALVIGTMMGLDRDELIELGIGCIIHDLGMMQVDPKIVDSTQRLSRIDFLEITKHPTRTFDMISSISEIPTSSRMVAYQVHERCDGSGYPRGRKACQIHPLAKIAAVADVFVALISFRPHRRGCQPYEAITKVLEEAHRGTLDSQAVRALLHAVSLFPIGSLVELSDGRWGTVIRGNGKEFARPVLEVDSKIIDLMTEANLRILRPLSKPPVVRTDEPSW